MDDQQSIIDHLRSEGYKVTPSYWKRNIVSLITIPIIGLYLTWILFYILAMIAQSIKQ